MQTTCPQCSQAILVDDAKIPERAFSIRCPRCKATVRFPGKGGEPASPPSESAASGSAPMSAPRADVAAPPTTTATPPSPQSPTADDDASEPEQPGHRGHALVALSNASQAGALSTTLTRLGFMVDVAEGDDETARRVEQGVYALVVTQRTSAPQNAVPTFAQRVSRLGSESRRRVFVVLVGDDLQTGDGMQAFMFCADLVLNPRDLSSTRALMRDALAERRRLYQVFLDAKERFESQ